MATPPLRNSDVAWIALLLALALPALFGAMFTSAAYVTPWLLGVANCTERDALGKLIEAIVLFGGMIVGFVVGFCLFALFSRAFASAETQVRWKQQFENQALRQSALHRWVGTYIMKLMGA